MVDEWIEKTLGDVVDIKHGYAFKGEYFRDEPIGDILLTPGNFAVGGGFKSDKLKFYIGPVPDEFILRSGDLIVTMTDLSKNADTLGYPAIVPVKSEAHRFLHNQRLGKVVPKDSTTVDTRYLHYLMCSHEYRHEVVASATGTTVKHTSPERIKRFRFRLPPLPEQRAIAHILGTLDDKIELNRRMSETLEAMARAIFKSWFVDFDPVRAKMQSEQPAGFAPEIAALFPDALVETELGEAPEGWEVGTLGDAIVLHDSKRIPLSSRQRAERKGEFPYYGAASVVDYVDDYLFDGVYVLMGEDGSVVNDNDTPVLQYVWGKFWVNNHAHVLTGRDNVSVEQLLLFLQTLNIRPYVTGAVQPKLNQGNLRRVPMLLAPNPVNRIFGQIIAPIFAQLRTACEQSRILAALRDTLLPKLISGELRVADAERFVGATA